LQERQKPKRKRKLWRIVAIVAGVILVAGIVGGALLWNYHKKPQFCSTFCHIMQPYVVSWNGSDLSAHAHGQAGITCLDCHEPTIQEQVQEVVAYVKQDYATPLAEPKFSQEWCLRCHDHDSYADLAERTKDYTIDGELQNPHDPHAGVETVSHKPYDCSNCHKVHKESPGVDFCYECHHDGGFISCQGSDCHEAGEGF
jgi:hypothetical protein